MDMDMDADISRDVSLPDSLESSVDVKMQQRQGGQIRDKFYPGRGGELPGGRRVLLEQVSGLEKGESFGAPLGLGRVGRGEVPPPGDRERPGRLGEANPRVPRS